MVKISVISPTVRPEGLKMVENCLKKQTFTDWEWLIGCKQVPDQFPYAIWIEDNFKNGFWTFNRTMNKLFKTAKSELCISWQDWIHIPPDGLEKFWLAYEETKGEAFLTGVGDQYQEWDGKRKPSIKIWSDPRKNTKYGSFYECNFPDIEWNWGAIPKALFDKLGGLDEKLDFLGYDGATYQLAERYNDMGGKFYIDQDNESYTLRHDRSAHGGQENWDKNHTMFAQNNGITVYAQRKNELLASGNWPILH